MVPIGEATTVLYSNISMHGLNGIASLIVVEPGDMEGLIEEMPEHAFYMHAPQFHWTVAMGGSRGQVSSFCRGEHCPRAFQVQDIDGGVSHTADRGLG